MRGSSLIGVMMLSVLMGLLSWIVLNHAQSARQRIVQRKYELQAEAMARSGLDYARAMAAHGRWRSDQRYTSGPLDGGTFVLALSRAGSGWQVRSTGVAGPRSYTLESRLP